jgi:Tol biopolymer transport system component
MKRAYIIAAVILVIGFGVGIDAIIANRITIPDVPVSNLHLRGHLLLTSAQEGVSIYDLATGEFKTLFTPAQGGLMSSATRSPDGSTLILSYAPPAGFIQFGFTNLYAMPADGSKPPQLLVDGKQQQVIYSPSWSPDGKNVDYVRSRTTTDGLTTQLSIERMTYPPGDTRTLVENGFAPDLSADGTRLAYVAVQAGTSFDGLFVAGADGDRAAQVTGGAHFQVIDRPSFSANGQTIAFTGDQSPFTEDTRPHQPRPTDWTELFDGVGTASAHDVPASDIWSVPTTGGTPVKLAKVLAQGIMLDYSPDGQHIAFVTTQGLYVMNADGSQLNRISNRDGLQSVQWLPD